MLQIISVITIILIMMYVVAWGKKKLPHTSFSFVAWAMLLVYMVGNLYCTLFSRVPGSGLTVELKPFMSIVRLYSGSDDYVGKITGFFAWFMQRTVPCTSIVLNILLYAPLGYLLPIIFPKLKPKHVILIGCLCSIATEATQYLFKMGYCETDDVLYNTLGTAIGVWVWLWQSKRLNAQRIANPGKGEV